MKKNRVVWNAGAYADTACTCGVVRHAGLHVSTSISVNQLLRSYSVALSCLDLGWNGVKWMGWVN